MTNKIRVVHYINQFFAGLGGEEHAATPPQRRDGAVGPGRVFQATFGDAAEIVATFICGDNYFSDQPDQAADDLLDLIVPDRPDVLIAGPGFDSGRYGMACGKICQVAGQRLGIPTVTGVALENPAAEIYAPYTYIVPTGNTAATMRQAVPSMAALALKLAWGETLGTPEQDNYLPRGRRRNIFDEDTAARRAVRMLLRKVAGEPYQTELRLPSFDHISPAPPIVDLTQAILAVGTEGGTVPFGNPDGIEAVRATKWTQYSIAGLEAMPAGQYESAHGGYDARFSNADPNRMIPLDGLRALEARHEFRQLYQSYFSTVGCGMPVANATAIGQAMAQEMKARGIDGMIMTAT
jgi:glycine reductase